MNRIPGILKIIFVILVLVTVGEIGYYLYFQFTSRENSLASGTIEPTPIHLSDILPDTSQTSRVVRPTQVPNQALDGSSLFSLAHIKRGLLSSSIVINEYRGKILKIDKKGGEFPGTNIKYEISLKIQGETPENTNTFYFTASGFNKTQVLKGINGEEKPIGFDELAINDKIIMKETLDLTKDSISNLIEMKLIKI